MLYTHNRKSDGAQHRLSSVLSTPHSSRAVSSKRRVVRRNGWAEVREWRSHRNRIRRAFVQTVADSQRCGRACLNYRTHVICLRALFCTHRLFLNDLLPSRPSFSIYIQRRLGLASLASWASLSLFGATALSSACHRLSIKFRPALSVKNGPLEPLYSVSRPLEFSWSVLL